MDLNDDWQSRKSVVECNRHMWTTKEATDITFIVGTEQKRIEAHKYVLLSRSCVFYAMFAGPLSGNTGAEVDIPDLDPETFNSLMVFLYCDEVKVDLNNVLALLYAAKKYCIQSLIDKCLNKLKSNMVASNVSVVMETAHRYGNNELVSRCRALILREPAEVFQSETFGDLCNDCLASVLQEDTLCAKEEEIFEAVMRFSEEKCRQNGVEVTPENRKKELENVLKEVRFPLMDSEYFVEKVEPSGLLSDRECLKLMRYFIKKQGEIEGFNNNPRKYRSIAVRFEELGAGWGYKRDKVDEISFKVSCDVMIHGIQLYGSNNSSCTYEARLKLMQEPYKGIMNEKKAMLETDGAQRTYTMLFNNPVKVEKDKTYTFQLFLKGLETYSGELGNEEVEADGVKFTFIDSRTSTNNTTTVRGQIPGIVFEMVPPQLPEQQPAVTV